MTSPHPPGHAKFEIGTRVACSDGACGHLERVVLDPVARAVTHLVVQPGLRRSKGRLVPVNRVAAIGTTIRLGCTKAAFDALEEAEETQFLSGTGAQLGCQADEILQQPYFPPHAGSFGPWCAPSGMVTPRLRGRPDAHTVRRDRVPLGEVEVRRGEHVHATDGSIGRVKGLLVDPRDHHVTHFLLDEGHLRGQKTVAIPIGAVTSVSNGVRLDLTKAEVDGLPCVRDCFSAPAP